LLLLFAGVRARDVHVLFFTYPQVAGFTAAVCPRVGISG